jgi:putative transposase
MSAKTVYRVVRRVSFSTLRGWIKKENDARVKERLIFVSSLYNDVGVLKACVNAGITKATGYSWLKRWNDGGYEGLIPHYGVGRPSRLSADQKNTLVMYLDMRDDWGLREIEELISEEFGVKYSERHVRTILKSIKMRHAKPYMSDYRQPDDAPLVLKKEWMKQ